MPLLCRLVLPPSITSADAFDEIFRAGILSLPPAQNEASLSLHSTGNQSMRLVVFSQAVGRVTPSAVGQLASNAVCAGPPAADHDPPPRPTGRAGARMAGSHRGARA